MKDLIVETLPSPGLFKAHALVCEAARILAGDMESGLHAQLLTVAAELRQREREAADLATPEDE
jgi:hypothetical protein